MEGGLPERATGVTADDRTSPGVAKAADCGVDGTVLEPPNAAERGEPPAALAGTTRAASSAASTAASRRVFSMTTETKRGETEGQ